MQGCKQGSGSISASSNSLQAMQFAALGRIADKRGLEELYSCCHDDRHIPIFSGLRQPDRMLVCFVFGIVQNTGMMLQHVAVAEYGSECARSLFDNSMIHYNIT